MNTILTYPRLRFGLVALGWPAALCIAFFLLADKGLAQEPGTILTENTAPVTGTVGGATGQTAPGPDSSGTSGPASTQQTAPPSGNDAPSGSATETVTEPVRDTAGQVDGTTEPVQETVGQTAEPVQQTTGEVADPVNRTAEPVRQTAEPVVGTARQTVEPVADEVGWTAEPIRQAAEPVVQPVREAAEATVQPVRETVEPVTDTITEPIGRTVEPVREVIEGTTEPVRQTVDPVREDVVTPIAGPVTKPVQETLEPVTDTVTKPVRSVTEPVTDTVLPSTDKPPDATVQPANGGNASGGLSGAAGGIGRDIGGSGNPLTAEPAAAQAPALVRPSAGGESPVDGPSPSSVAVSGISGTAVRMEISPLLSQEEPQAAFAGPTNTSFAAATGMEAPVGTESPGFGLLDAFGWSLDSALPGGDILTQVSSVAGGIAGQAPQSSLPGTVPVAVGSSGGLGAGSGGSGVGAAILFLLLLLSRPPPAFTRVFAEYLRPSSTLRLVTERPG